MIPSTIANVALSCCMLTPDHNLCFSFSAVVIPFCFIGVVSFPSHSFLGADRWMYLINGRIVTSEFHLSDSFLFAILVGLVLNFGCDF